MKKRIRLIITTFILFITLTPTIVLANCAKAEDLYKDYTNYKAKYDSQCKHLYRDYSGEYDSETFIKKQQECQKLELAVKNIKNKAKQEYEKDRTCEDTLNKIITDTDCSGRAEIFDLANQVMNIFLLVAPFLLIIFVSFDLLKIVTMGAPDDAKKAKQNIVKRVIAFLLLLLVPAIVHFITSFEVFNKDEFECKTIDKKDLGVVNDSFESVLETGIDAVKKKAYEIITQKIRETSISDSTGTVYPPISTSATASQIVSTAANYSATLKDWTYGMPKTHDIKAQTYNPNKSTVCSSYVASVLYLSGALPEDFINKYDYNWANATGVIKMVKEAGWTKITSYDAMQPGDVVFTTNDFKDIGHTMIYAGNDSWYTAGSKEDIRKGLVKTTWYKSRFVVAYRKP